MSLIIPVPSTAENITIFVYVSYTACETVYISHIYSGEMCKHYFKIDYYKTQQISIERQNIVEKIHQKKRSDSHAMGFNNP